MSLITINPTDVVFSTPIDTYQVFMEEGKFQDIHKEFPVMKNGNYQKIPKNLIKTKTPGSTQILFVLLK